MAESDFNKLEEGIMITSNISIILYVTGIITASMLLLFISPRLVMEKMFGLKSDGGAAELFERHWGMAIFITGLLLVWAGYDAAIRKPVLACVALNKAAFVCLVLFNYKKGYVRNFALTLAFDTACVIVFIVYLLGWA
jgi:hypothetical protein